MKQKEELEAYFSYNIILIFLETSPSLSSRQIKYVDFLLRLRFGGIAKRLTTIYELMPTVPVSINFYPMVVSSNCDFPKH